MERRLIGDVEVTSLLDTTFVMNLEDVYPAAGEEQRLAAKPHLVDGKIHMPCQSFLVRDGDRTLLVDTGQGPEADGALMALLAEAGVAPEDVDTVVFTHLHGDHTGWNISRETGRPAFANARYLVPRLDWEHYRAKTPANDAFVRDVVPLAEAGQLDMVDDGDVVSASLTCVATPGHTPGHTSLAVRSAEGVGFLLGDVVVSAVDVADPDLPNRYDWDDSVARSTRHAVLGRLEGDGSLVAASHVPPAGFGTIGRSGDGRVWLPA